NSASQFTDFYNELVGCEADIQAQIHEKKAYILNEHMRGELENLFQFLVELDLENGEALKGVDREMLKEAIGELLIMCPVYRYYGRAFPLAESEEAAVSILLGQIKSSKAHLALAVDILEEILLTKPKEGDETYNNKVLNWYQRLMQFTGPLMAKGVEDTLMYTYNRFVGHNEVG